MGTGFSYTTEEGGYAEKREDYEDTLYAAMQQFYALFPDKLDDEFYITGESYAGHYIPALAHKIHVENGRGGRPRVPLAGFAIGDGWSDPETMVMQYADMLYSMSLIDGQQQRQVQEMQEEVLRDIRAEDWEAAFLGWDRLINGDVTGPSFVQNVTGIQNYFNLLSPDYPTLDLWDEFLNQTSTRRALHVGDAVLHDGHEVEMHLVRDVMQSVKPLFPVLLANYKALVYSGQLDVIVGAQLTTAFLDSIRWEGSAAWAEAEREIWKSGGETAGYVKRAGYLTNAIVRNAGHLVPTDQPAWAKDLITRWVEGTPYGR